MYPTMQQYKNSIDLIKGSIENESSDAVFYQWLIDNIPRNSLTGEEANRIQKTIESIRDDELSHNKIFKAMYQQLTGRMPAIPEEEKFVPPSSFIDGVITALNGELNAVKRYREIMSGLPNNYYRDQVFNILTDELRHANLYNYVYTTVTK